MKKIAIIMGSDSDFPVVKDAAVELKKLGIPYEVRVMSAHRTPDMAAEFSKNARTNGFERFSSSTVVGSPCPGKIMVSSGRV